MTDMQADAIKHYEEMIAWAKTQPPDRCADYAKMYYSIRQNWFGHNCSYCKGYAIANCKGCPLDDNDSCCHGLWSKMDKSQTWKEWIGYAEKVLEYIKENGGEG